jgi:hypothetical protein
VLRLRTLHPEQNFTQLANQAMDILPDLHSLGLLAHVLRHSDDWDFELKDLVERKSGLTRRDASNARATLVRHGFWITVKFRHDHKGQFATDVYRAVLPHTEEDLALLAEMYKPGTLTQIPQLNADKKLIKDNLGRTLMRPVTITWARVDSWRGDEVVTLAGELLPDPKIASDTTPENAPDEGDGPVDNSGETAPARGTDSGTSARPAETGVCPGGSEVPPPDTSGARPVGGRQVKKKTSPPDQAEDKRQAGGVPPAPPVPDASADADASGLNQQTQDPYLEPTELQYPLNPLRARAWKAAGEAAVRAIQADPHIGLDQLAKLIGKSDPQLTQGQRVGRASTLQAFEARAAELNEWQPAAARPA